MAFSYDANNNASTFIDTINGTVYTTSYTYDKDNRPTEVKSTQNNKTTYAYDGLGRLSSKSWISGSTTYTTSYTYKDKENSTTGETSTQVASITNGTQPAFIYTYDPNGNIKTITNSGLVIEYFYDALGQVIREDNQRDNNTVIYGYDFGGNILSKTTYGYTTGSVDNLTPTDTDTYGYTNTNWKDQLTSFNGNAITYDFIGNPLTYQGKTFTWDKGRQLSAITAPGSSISYTYNDSGIRTSKTVNGTTTNYHLSGDKVTYEKTGDVYSYYTYDSNGQLVSINANGTEYYYVRNVQNDIIGLVDSSGTIVVNYTYSTYGEVVSITGSLASTLGATNPYRYRGYRFNTETGYYYLQSRYYDPGMGRFINADGLISASSTLLGTNMYGYCENNPIKYFDINGYYLSSIEDRYLGGIVEPLPIPYGAVKILMDSIVFGILCILDNISDENSKDELKEEDKKVKFPATPEEFHPIGLVPILNPGSYNGRIIKS